MRPKHAPSSPGSLTGRWLASRNASRATSRKRAGAMSEPIANRPWKERALGGPVRATRVLAGYRCRGDARSASTRPRAGIDRLLDRNGASLFLSVVTIAEIDAGILKLRRERKNARADELTSLVQAILTDFGSLGPENGAKTRATCGAILVGNGNVSAAWPASPLLIFVDSRRPAA